MKMGKRKVQTFRVWESDGELKKQDSDLIVIRSGETSVKTYVACFIVENITEYYLETDETALSSDYTTARLWLMNKMTQMLDLVSDKKSEDYLYSVFLVSTNWLGEDVTFESFKFPYLRHNALNDGMELLGDYENIFSNVSVKASVENIQRDMIELKRIR